MVTVGGNSLSVILSDMYLFCAFREEPHLAGAAREEFAPAWMLQPHALELRDLVCPGLHAPSCQASGSPGGARCSAAGS